MQDKPETTSQKCDECGQVRADVRHVENKHRNCNACCACVPVKCDGGCSFWDCARPAGHAGPCQP